MKKIYVITFLTILIDQILKIIVMNTIPYQKVIDVIPNFFYITQVKNTGGAWSILSNHTIILTLIGIIACTILIYYIHKQKSFSKLEIIYLAIITGGIIGNLIDRILYQGVIDFIGLTFGSYDFPIFNYADMMIVIGAILLIIDSIRGSKNEFRSN